MGPWSHLWLAFFGPSLMRASVVGVFLCVVLLANGGEAVELRVLAAGATEATLRSVVGTFEQESGHTIRLAYGAVGLLRDQIYAGARPDLTIVTPAILEQLQAKGLVVPATAVALGRVGGGIAVRVGTPYPAVGSPEALREALLAAEEIYYADPATATAGAHFLRVADRLGIGTVVRQKGRAAAGGREAMRRMVQSAAKAIGLTQISEILSVPEVALVGPYPGDLQAMTTYTGILLAHAAQQDAAQAFLRFLTSPLVQAKFRQAGFEPPQ